MAETTQRASQRTAGAKPPSVPEDVNDWLKLTLQPGENVCACLFADIGAKGAFQERWAFLTNRRLFVLTPNGQEGRADLDFQMPLNEVTGARVEEYVGSSALIVNDQGEGHEIARFSLGSHHEASDLCHYIEAIVKERASGKSVEEMRPAATRRPEHRCSKCGRALSRWSEVCPYCIERSRLLARLFSYLTPYIPFAVIGLTLTVGITALTLTPPLLMRAFVDRVLVQKNLSLFAIIIVVWASVRLGSALVSVFRSYVMQWLGNKVLFDLRVELYDHLQLLRLSYYNRHQTGQIMQRVTGDLNRLQYFIAEGFQEVLVNATTMVLIAGILLLLNWELFLVILAPIPIIILSIWVFGRRVHQLYHRLWRQWGGLNAILADTIPGVRVVKSFAQEERESNRFSDYSADLFGQEMGVVKLSSGFFPFLDLMTGVGSLLIFGIGGYMVINGSTTLGTLMAFTSYMWQFYQPVQRFGDLNHRFQHCITSAERVFEILDSDPEPLLRKDGIVLSPLKGKVEFRNVRFSYDPGKYALDGVSFVVQPGEMIGLVGPSGAGKSTLVHLIARFYDVDEGEVLIDDHDVQDLSLRSYREQIGVVLQEPYLFYGSVWANIAYAKPEASADEIIDAAKAANAHEFVVNLPDGYDTIIGERGQTLSGGERQRISIARAILRDPGILILDEATASVDTETEALIQVALERLVKNRTTFAIAHRLSTLRKANRLIVLERGKLIEIGTHEELIESGGLYGRLCKLQSELSKMRAW